MPLKPVFDKAPLTMLTSQPLRAGQVRVNLPALTRLYAQVENRREPLLLEGAFRLACLVKADAMQSPAVTAIREAAAAQREDGSFALTIEDSVYVLRAVWALYEAEAKKEDLTVLLRWFQWAAKQWDDIAADEYVRAFPADLLELQENVYRITGIPAMLKLARTLSASTMNWSGVLTATPIQTPVSKAVSAEELDAGLKKENGDLEGYYTRLALTTNAAALADGARAALARGDLPAALSAVPSPAPLQTAEARGFVHEEEALTQALLYRLRTASPDALAALYGMDEGLERRFLAAAQTCASREALLDFVKTKRYTRARLSRLCAYALLDLSRDFAQAHRAPEYARVLGFRRSAAPLLKAVKRRSAIPLVTKAADFDRAHPLFALDVRAQDLWSLGVSNPALRSSGRDFTTSPILV